MNFHDLDAFTIAYIECALWTSTDNSNEQGGNPLADNYGPEDISPGTLQQMIEDCVDFQASNHDMIKTTSEQAGHDFWLTRNHHGAGFWDRGLGDIGKKLTEAAHAYGSFDLYVGDDGLVHGM